MKIQWFLIESPRTYSLIFNIGQFKFDHIMYKLIVYAICIYRKNNYSKMRHFNYRFLLKIYWFLSLIFLFFDWLKWYKNLILKSRARMILMKTIHALRIFWIIVFVNKNQHIITICVWSEYSLSIWVPIQYTWSRWIAFEQKIASNINYE